MDEDRQSGADGAGDALSDALRAALAAEAEAIRPRRMPRSLQRRLEASAEAWLHAEQQGATGDAPAVVERTVVDRRAARLASYAAAACLLLAIVGWWPRIAAWSGAATLAVPALEPLVENERDRLLASGSPHVGRWAWAHETGLAPGVGGDVVWDSELQRGYLTLTGLPPSAGSGRQYQLWIFDAARDDRYPVDGGVFDVPPEGAQTLTVPIRPALRIERAAAFAVTLEPTGGVVVSDRRHLVALARADAR